MSHFGKKARDQYFYDEMLVAEMVKTVTNMLHVIVISHTFRLQHALATVGILPPGNHLINSLSAFNQLSRFQSIAFSITVIIWFDLESCIWINQVRLEIRNHFSSHYLAFNETVSLKLISGERQIKIIPIFNSDLEQF